MAKIVGIDLGTTYSAVSIWDDRKKEAIIIPNLEGSNTTPSVVSLNKAGEVIVGQMAKQNLWADPQNTVSQIKREMGNDFKVSMGGKPYNPQTISAFILGYLKLCAERYLGEPVHDAVITVPAYFTEVQRGATRDAGRIAGFNVHRLINEPTAAAIAYGVSKDIKPGEQRLYAVYDLGGGTFDVSVIQITPDDITVVGTAGDPRLGGLDMDEAVMKWALREINTQYGVDLSADEGVKRRLKVEAEGVKKALVMAENASLNVPFLTVIDGKPLNVDLMISRARFEMLIAPLLKRSLVCMEAAVASANEHNQVDWSDLDGVLLVGGPTRLSKIHKNLEEILHQHNPDKEPLVRHDANPDEVVAMGAAIVAAGCTPIGHPPEEVEKMDKKEVEKIENQNRAASETENAPKMDIYDVTGHSLGIAVEGFKFHKIIEKETPIPYSAAHGPFTNAADYTTELLVEVYQGEEEYVQANTKIGEVKIQGLEPLPRGTHILEVRFSLDVSGTLSTICTDLRTKVTYTGTFAFDGITRMSEQEIRERRAMMSKLAGMNSGPAAPPPDPKGDTTPPPPEAMPQLAPEQVPADWRDYWLEARDEVAKLEGAKKGALLRVMAQFAAAVRSGNPNDIEDKAYLLQDALLEART